VHAVAKEMHGDKEYKKYYKCTVFSDPVHTLISLCPVFLQPRLNKSYDTCRSMTVSSQLL
jgi:hypothetical protein